MAAALRLALALDGGVLPIQGPPGSGKTYTGARMITAMANALDHHQRALRVDPFIPIVALRTTAICAERSLRVVMFDAEVGGKASLRAAVLVSVAKAAPADGHPWPHKGQANRSTRPTDNSAAAR